MGPCQNDPPCNPFFPSAYSYVLGVQDWPPPPPINLSGYTNFDPDGPISTTYANLLNCFGFREIINEDVNEIELNEGEALLMEFLRKTESLNVIKEVLKQNEELAKQLCDKVYPNKEEKCSKCKHSK